MARPLDGIGLLAYCRRQGFSRDTQQLLARIRSSPPSRTPGARRGNMPVWYPSKKMQCIIKAESANDFLLASFSFGHTGKKVYHMGTKRAVCPQSGHEPLNFHIYILALSVDPGRDTRRQCSA